jgi:hypothetical protein
LWGRVPKFWVFFGQIVSHVETWVPLAQRLRLLQWRLLG